MDITQPEREVILAFLQQFRPIFTGSQADVELADQVGCEQADFQVGEVLADTAVGSGAKGAPGVLVEDEIGP